jgi:hypothetical protein
MRELKRRQLEKRFAWIDQSYSDESWADTVPPEELKESLEAKALDVGLVLIQLKNFLNNELAFMTEALAKEAERLREEIIQDIDPVVNSLTGDEVLTALAKLVSKINAMHLHPPWTVVDKKIWKDLIEGPPLVGLDVPPAGPVLHIGGKELIVYHKVYAHYPGSKEDFYSVIIKTLEDGSFQKLKRCKECQRFFVADRLSEKFCRPECSKAYFDRGALDRVRKSRAKPQVEDKRHVGKKQSKKRRPPATVKVNRRKHRPNVKAGRRPRKQSNT